MLKFNWIIKQLYFKVEEYNSCGIEENNSDCYFKIQNTTFYWATFMII